MQKWQLNFNRQLGVGIGLIILAVILSQVFRNGIFHNVAWVIYGTMCILNPVWPESWEYADPEKMKKGSRIAGVICIIIGIVTHFGV